MKTSQEILDYAVKQYKAARHIYVQAGSDIERDMYYSQLIPLAHLIMYAKGEHDGERPIDVLNIPLEDEKKVAGTGVAKAMGIKG